MTADALRPGDPAMLGRYRLAGRLGSGGQGVVYEGYDEVANRVAVKVLHAYLSGDSPLRRRFTREVTAAQQVASFCTARILDHDLDGERPYIVTEFVPGPSLRAAVREEAPLSGDPLHRLAVGIATALAAIHQADVVHRDLKPENVLLGPDGPRVIDFGIARAAGLSMTSMGELAGTPMYMAPELFSGGRAEPAADVFAWGAVVLFAATGRDAFTAPTTFAVINRLLNHDPDIDVLPERLRELVRAALSKDPAARPSAEHLLLALLAGGGEDGGGEDGGVRARLAEGAEAAADVRPPGGPADEPTLGAVAEQCYAGLPPSERQVARDLLLRLVDVRDSDEAPRIAALDELIEVRHAERVLAAFEQAMVVRRQGDAVAIGNAALLYAWPRLHEWVTGDREALGRHRELGEAARRWARNGRRPEDLLRGTALRQALEWTDTTHLTLNTTEQTFVEVSRTASVRLTRRRRLVTTGLTVLLVASLTGGALAWQQSVRSDEAGRRLADERAQATARRVALQADALREIDPVKAMLLSVAAYRIAPVPESASAVLSSLAQQEQSVFTDPAPANEGRALSPDGRTLVSAGAGRVTAYDVVTGRPVRTFGGIGEAPVTAAMGPDGDTLALARGKMMELWSLRTGKRLGGGRWGPEEMKGDDGRPDSVEFSPGGGYIVVRDNIGGPYVALWNVARRALEKPQKPDEHLGGALLGPDDRFGLVNGALRAFPDGGTPAGRRLPRDVPGAVLAFSPDGALAAVQGSGTRLWNLSTGTWDRRVLPGLYTDAVFSPDGRFLITFVNAAGGRLTLWRLDDAAPTLRLTVASRIVGSPRLDSGNRTLRILDDAGRVTTYDVGRLTGPRRVLPPDALHPRFTASGDALFALTGGTVRRWSVPGFTENGRLEKRFPLRGRDRDALITQVSPDGRTVVTLPPYDLKGPTLWDAESGRKLGEVPVASEYDRADMQISPDGRLLAISHTLPSDYYGRGSVVIVDLAQRKQVMRFGPVAGGSLSFSSDSRFLVTADQGGTDVIDLVARRVLPPEEGPGTLAERWMTLAPKGPLGASPYGSRAVALWDTRTWRTTGRVFRVPGDVVGARFSPDGRILAVAHDTRVTLFDVVAGRQLGAGWTVTTGTFDPNAMAGPMPALAFTADGSLLRVVGYDGAFQELPVDPAKAVPAVCARAGRRLAPEEWREHVGTDLGYQEVCSA
ncbi:WD40 repeat domain-containing serine/threonine protein kinase [Microbispora sp. H13382]|uniref:WD40 repeat domain-containing serine/threonine protein kinase n=1 Tax=Microbispora sp. H13382 TaxID=2729112 RepID=UPI00160116B7|nr:serine/threonine-protein kinase [Microbispora sp. H13382]